MKHKKTEPWRVIAAIAAVIYIVFLWVKKNIPASLTVAGTEDILPFVITNLAVTLIKIAAIAAVIFLAKKILKAIIGNKKDQ